MRLPLWLPLSLSLLILLFSRSLAAQGATGEIRGRVTDLDESRIAQAAITIIHVDTGAVRHLSSDEHGRFASPALPVGRYQVTAASDGFAPRRQEDLVLHPGERVTLQLRLRRAVLPETLTVGLTPAQLEFGRTDEGFLIESRYVENLPTPSRQFLRFPQLAPAISADGATGSLSVMGHSSALNRLIVDGFDHTSSVTGEPFGTLGGNRAATHVSEVAIDEIHVGTNGYPVDAGRAGAGVFSVVTKSGTNAIHGSAFEFFGDRALNAERTGQHIDFEPYRSNQFGGVLGGPVVRDRDFLLGSYEGLRRTTTDRQDQDLSFARLDHRFTDAHRMMARYTGQRFTGAPWDLRTWTAGASFDSALSAGTVNEARVQYVTSRDEEALVRNLETTRVQASDSLSFVSGGHSMKAGVDALFDENSGTFGPVGARPGADPDSNSYAAFIEDAWRAGESLTVDLGLRYDVQTMPLVPRDTNNWAPRVSVALATTDHSVLRGGYGIFYGMTPALIPAFAGIDRRPSVSVVDSAFQNPQVRQAHVGWEWEKYRAGTAGVSYLFAQGRQLPRVEELSASNPANRVTAYRSNGESLYNGVTFHMRMRFFEDLYYTASVTYAKADDSGPGLTSAVPGTSAADRRTLSLSSTAKGPSDNGQHVLASLGATYDTTRLADDLAPVLRAMAGHWVLSLIYVRQTGQPYSAWVLGDRNADGNAFNDLAPATTRNQYRLPVRASLDPRIARDVLIGERARLSLIWEAFNVTNRPNYVAADDNAFVASGGTLRANPGFGRYSAQTSGRVMQLAARVAF